jgi:hypothetical protein
MMAYKVRRDKRKRLDNTIGHLIKDQMLKNRLMLHLNQHNKWYAKDVPRVVLKYLYVQPARDEKEKRGID